MFGRRNKPAFVADNTKRVLKTVKVVKRDPSTAAAPVDMIKKVGVPFEKKVESAVNLNKNVSGPSRGVVWNVIGLLDESYSMDQFFYDGTVQEIVDRVLAWSASVDADGLVPFGGFANSHVWHGDVDLTNVNNVVATNGWSPWGGTNLADSLKAILDMVKDMGDAWQENPILLFIVTDGMPHNQALVKQYIQELSQYPVFIKILRVGNDPGAKAFVEDLDNMNTGRLVDNVEAPDDGLHKGMSDDKFNAAMIHDMDKYVNEATAAGLLS
ncbi:hypothetical protein SEA_SPARKLEGODDESS_115 [Streptomyces phage SparkleGoddess]|uniref:VWFA domain-containing protein n=2 Tax=Gilsonvirus comrade TaxID=2846395 RepID=A0A345ME36_9CAUD|nr:hypothetical protein SEA_SPARKLEGODDESS_115 [Streptomyces phage SparkleGoddess]QQO39792.1 hypothetical protein SEA_BELFORT_117 [Streptomyces phage Belfort]